MVKPCCVKGCHGERNKICGISFHRFPSDKNLRAKWLEAIGLNADDIKSKNPLICSRHFKITDFKPTFLAKLKEDAVPFKEEDEVILIDQDQESCHDDIKQERSDSLSSFEDINMSENTCEPSEKEPSETRILRPAIQFYERGIQTTAYAGPREQRLEKKVKSLQTKLTKREVEIKILKQKLRKGLIREKILMNMLSDAGAEG